MIIATIGATSFKLENPADAAALLDIAQRAIPVSSSWDAFHKQYWYIDDDEPRLTLEIVAGDRVLDLAQHREARAARDEKNRQIEAAGIEADLA